MEQKSFEQSNKNRIKFFFGLENLNFTSTHKQPPRSKATKEVEKMTKFKDCAIRAQTCIIVDMTSLKKNVHLEFFFTMVLSTILNEHFILKGACVYFNL
jgi:hypothetical protein